MTQSPRSSQVSPKLSLAGASVLGVASMLGAGVFIVFGPASLLAGRYLFLAVLIAAVIAALNARSMRQLSAELPGSGGAYRFGREYLSNTAGFIAGYCFVLGKIGSVAAIALVVASYSFPNHKLAVGLVAIGFMTLINLLGIRRTALGAFLLSLPTVVLLGVVIAVGLNRTSYLSPTSDEFSLAGVLGAASMVFFAFAGYARVATLGGEVNDSQKTVPRAITISLSFVLAIYLLLAFVLQQALGDSLKVSQAPILDFATTFLPSLSTELVIAVAASASLGSMLALLAGISRVVSTMANDRELPRVFAKVSKRHSTPYVAELTVAVAAGLLLLNENLNWTIGISSSAVLTYYAIANLAAFAQAKKLTQKSWSLLGFGCCLLVAVFVPWQALVTTFSLLIFGLVIRLGLKSAFKPR